MGIIQRQSIKSSFIITIGFAIGAFNMLILAPKILSAPQIGLTRVIIDAGTTLATICTLGCISIIYKFFPFYKSYLSPRRNDLPFMTMMICLAGFLILCIGGYVAKDLVVRKFSGRSPLFVEYSYLVYPYSFCLLAYIWLESFGWSFKKGVIANALRETFPRLLFTGLLLLFTAQLISFPQFLNIFSFSFLLPAITLFIILRKTGDFLFNPTPSSLTRRLKGKMVNFGLFLFGAQVLNLLSRTVDTFILTAKAERGLTDTAVFTIATYIITLMEIPQRSMNAITIPVLAESWKNKDLKNIEHVYAKSITNLLIIGLAMFAVILLNVHNLNSFLGKDYKGIQMVVLVLGIGKLIDLGTGANAQIIGTSSFWKVDFTTNVIYTILALPLNYILIAHYGLMGAAYSTVISLTLFNLMRFGFLWYKFNLQPYRWKDLLAIIIAVFFVMVTYYVPRLSSIYADAAVRTTLFCTLFFSIVYYLNLSTEINQLIKKYLLALKKLMMR